MKHILTFHNGPWHGFCFAYDDRMAYSAGLAYISGYDGEYAVRSVVQDFTVNTIHKFYVWQGASS